MFVRRSTRIISWMNFPGAMRTYRNLLILISNTHTVVDQAHIVAEKGISRILRDDTKRNEERKTISVALGLHEIKVAAVVLVLHLQTNGLLNFTILKLNGGVVLVAVSVVVSECAQCFLVAFFGNKPARRFRDPC